MSPAEESPGNVRDPRAVNRKKVLLNILARREAPKHGVEVSPDTLRGTAHWFRVESGLIDDEAFLAWLDREGLSASEFLQAVRDMSIVQKLEQQFCEQIEVEAKIATAVWAALLNEHADERETSEIGGACRSTSLASGAPAPPFDPRDDEWTQFNITPTKRDGGLLWSARHILGKFASSERSESERVQFFFLRKPPGLRLRVQHSGPAIAATVGGVLEFLKASGLVQSWARCPYEPEARLFGGPQAMKLIHRYFAADSDLWVQWDRLQQDQQAQFSTTVLSLAVLNGLFMAATDDLGEAWDVWSNLAALHGVAQSAAVSVPAVRVEDLLGRATASERTLLGRYRDANLQLAAGLRDLSLAGTLTVGIRALLPFVALFHWNRYAVSRIERARLCRAMMWELDVRRRLKGAALNNPFPGETPQTFG